jgi:serine/threonine protein kinase
MAYLRHDHLVALRDFLWDDTNLYLVMDLCRGGELFDYLANHDRLDEPTAALVFQQIVSALAFCHSHGVAHRDLKPENVLIVSFPYVKLADFGLCGFLSDSQLMQTFCGSPGYCSPESLSRIKYDGRLSDIWSLGVLLFSIVTGEHPWNMSNAALMLRQILKAAFTVPPHVSPDCRHLIEAMMSVVPGERIAVPAILEHPWLRLGNAVEWGESVPRPTTASVQAPPPMTMREIAEAAGRAEKRSEGVVVSPFEEGNGAAAVRLIARTLSFDQAGLGAGAPRTKFGPTPVQLRQKSVSNLKKVASRPPLMPRRAGAPIVVK